MTTERIKEIQSKTAYPNSVSVQQALLQVWNECEQEQLRIADVVGRSEQLKAIEKLKDFAYEVCPLHREDDLEEIVGSL